MRKEVPLVSVVIAAHNGESYIAEAIQSVLDQDYCHYELCVVDNGSSDRTGEITKTFPQVRYQSSDIANVALARNQGALSSQGEYIAFLDQDDTWISSKLRQQVQWLEEHPRFGAVIGWQRMYLQSGTPKPHWLKQEFLEKPQFAYLPSALMVRRSTFLTTHCFDTSFSLTSDVDWFFKAMDQGIEIGIIEEVLVHRRIHQDNNSNKCQEIERELLAVIKHSLRRRRGL